MAVTVSGFWQVNLFRRSKVPQATLHACRDCLLKKQEIMTIFRIQQPYFTTRIVHFTVFVAALYVVFPAALTLIVSLYMPFFKPFLIVIFPVFVLTAKYFLNFFLFTADSL